MGPLRAGVDVSELTDDALLNTTLSVVDFGTANDLDASTPSPAAWAWPSSRIRRAEPEQGLEHGLRDHVSSSFISETLDLHGTLLAMERFD